LDEPDLSPKLNFIGIN